MEKKKNMQNIKKSEFQKIDIGPFFKMTAKILQVAVETLISRDQFWHIRISLGCMHGGSLCDLTAKSKRNYVFSSLTIN